MATAEKSEKCAASGKVDVRHDAPFFLARRSTETPGIVRRALADRE